jgi:Tfp pilus assembly protein FimT
MIMEDRPIRADRRPAGFSLLELIVVTFILIVIGVIALPNMVNVVSNARLHGGATSLSAMLQNCRMLAVKENKTKTTYFDIMANGPVAYVKNATDVNTALASGDPQVQLGTPLTRYVTPTGADAPTTLDPGFTASTGNPSFNPSGLPCAYSGGNCTNSGFVYYFKDRRPMGKSGWAAVSISPAGRIKRWFWDGSNWTN